jgi:hypothetical protein
MPPPKPRRQTDAVAVYGRPDGRRLYDRTDGTTLHAWTSIAEGQQALGVDWIRSWHGIREAIPPAYSEFIGAAFVGQTVRC